MSVNTPLLSDRGLVFSSEFTSLLKKYPVPTEMYIVGSSSTKQFGHFNHALSDIDLLITPENQTFEDYVKSTTYARNISVSLNKDQLVDVFILNSRITDTYFACLSAIWGFNHLDKADRVLAGFSGSHHRQPASIDTRHRQNLYASKALFFCNQLAHDLPQADASSARRIAKDILKCLKLVACALAPLESMDDVEGEVFATKNFEKVISQIEHGDSEWGAMKDGLQVVVREGKTDDWSAWMMLQDDAARQLLSYDAALRERVAESRFYVALWQVWDLLTKGVKDVLLVEEPHFKSSISEFADRVTGVIVKLGLAGVDALVDFESATTPSNVVKASLLIEKHLQTDDLDRGDMRLLAASVILLEYAFATALESNAH